MQTASMEDSHFVRDPATDRMREAFCGVGSEGGQRDMSGTQPRVDTSRCGPHTRRPTGWARVFGGWQHTDGNAGAMDDSTIGLFVGVNTPVSENLRMGVTFSTAGLRGSAAITLGSVQGTVRGSLGWRHAFGDDTPVSTLRFQGGQQFGVAGVPIAQDAAVVDAGLDLNITKNAVLGVSYGAQLAGSSTAQTVQATLRVRF